MSQRRFPTGPADPGMLQLPRTNSIVQSSILEIVKSLKIFEIVKTIVDHLVATAWLSLDLSGLSWLVPINHRDVFHEGCAPRIQRIRPRAPEKNVSHGDSTGQEPHHFWPKTLYNII